MSEAGRRADPSALRLGLTLGLLSAIGPVSIDLYLPAFPRIAAEFGATPGEVQRTLSVFFLALAAAQIPIGSFGDRYGRRPTLLLGLALYVAASLACAVAPSIETLTVLRFVQGLGVCAGTAVSRAMIRDLHTGPQAARLMATSFLVIGISPILAPLLGSMLLAAMPWQGLFLVQAGFGVAGMLLVRFALPETLPPERRVAPGTPVLPAYRALLSDRGFVAGALVAGLATTIPYAYVTAAPFVFSGRFGLAPGGFSLLLALTAGSSILAMQASPLLMRRWGARTTLIRVALAGAALTGGLGVLLALGLVDLLVFQLYAMLLFALAGLLLTPAAVSALDAGKGGAGAAAGMLGAIQLAVTAVASGVVSAFPAFSLTPLLLVLGGALVLSVLLAAARPAN